MYPKRDCFSVIFIETTCNIDSILGCLPFDREIRLGCSKHNGKRFTSLPQNCHIRYGLNPKKGAYLCSVSLEPRRNREIGKWLATFRLVRTNSNERTTSKRTLPFSVGICPKVALTFTFHPEFPKFSAIGKHPWRKNNTATDNVANLLIFLCILDG